MVSPRPPFRTGCRQNRFPRLLQGQSRAAMLSVWLAGGCIAGAGLAGFAITGQAKAQQAPEELPLTADPSLIEPEYDIPVLGGDFAFSVELPGGNKVPPGMEDETLEFNDLAIEGATVFTRDDFLEIFQEDMGKTITFRRFFEIAAQIELKYHSEGYILAFSYFPEQSVDDGRYRINIVEGYINEVLVESEDDVLVGALRDLLEPLKEIRPLQNAELERRLLLANDLAGMKVSGVLQPAEGKQGASDLVVKARLNPVNFSASIDNRGSKYTGPWKGLASVEINAPFDLGEKFTLISSATQKTEEQIYVAGRAEFPLGYDGLWLDLRGSHSWSKPGYSLAALETEIESHSFSAGLRYNLLRSRFRNLTLGGSLNLRTSRTDLLRAKFTRDRIRTLSLFARYSDSGFLNGGTSASFKVTQGLPGFLHATDPRKGRMSRMDTEPAFNKIELEASRYQRLFGNLSLLTSAAGQWAFHPVPSSEEFSVGGSRFGRGYDSGEIGGDFGYAFSGELRWTQPVDWLFIDRVEPYLFWDWGSVWNIKTTTSAGLQETLSSGGGGFRLALDPGVNLLVEYAQPLTRPRATENGEMAYRLITRLSVRY